MKQSFRKRVPSILLAVTLLIGLLAAAPAYSNVALNAAANDWENPFTDVNESDWFYDSVQYVYEYDMFSGTSDTTFGPNEKMNSAMVITVLWRMAGSPEVDETGISGIPQDVYYANAMDWAIVEGIIPSNEEWQFDPDEYIIREQLVTLMWLFAQDEGVDVSAGENSNILSFNDAFEISDYAMPAMSWACAIGVVSGNTDNTLDPQGDATRAEVATIFMNLNETDFS